MFGDIDVSKPDTYFTVSDDVAYVIDTGRMNVARYNQLEKATDISTEWLRQSNFDQRSGRAGRVQGGKVWHLFSRLRKLSKYLEPEVGRARLESVVLTLRSLDLQYAKVGILPIRWLPLSNLISVFFRLVIF